MPSYISHKLKKKAVVKPLQIILLINIQCTLEGSECACVYFAVLSGNGPGIRFSACLSAWAHALSWTDASLSGPEVKHSHQHSTMSNLVCAASLLLRLHRSGPKANLHKPGTKCLQLEPAPLLLHPCPVSWASTSSFHPAESMRALLSLSKSDLHSWLYLGAKWKLNIYDLNVPRSRLYFPINFKWLV